MIDKQRGYCLVPLQSRDIENVLKNITVRKIDASTIEMSLQCA